MRYAGLLFFVFLIENSFGTNSFNEREESRDSLSFCSNSETGACDDRGTQFEHERDSYIEMAESSVRGTPDEELYIGYDPDQEIRGTQDEYNITGFAR